MLINDKHYESSKISFMIFTYSFILYSFFYLVEGIKLVIAVIVVDNPQHGNFYIDSSMRLPPQSAPKISSTSIVVIIRNLGRQND